MSPDRRRMRGQPLVVLGALLLGWTGARVTALSGEGALSLPEAVLTVGTATAAQADPVDMPVGPQSYAEPGFAMAPYRQPVQFVPVWAAPGFIRGHQMLRGFSSATYASGPFQNEPLRARYAGDFPIAFPSGTDSRNASESASFASFNPTPKRYGEASSILGGRLGRLIGNHARWSADAWALVRDDEGSAPVAGILPATYGASQTGAVLRYRLSLQDAHKPTAYLRTTSTLGALNEVTAALGLFARPLAAIPLVAAVEGRITDQNGSRRVQPAAMVVTELPQLTLPGSLRAEMYGQAGYVGGRFATPFADGQVRVDRSLLTLGRYEARLGAGAWGGIQKGASRFDAGPGATLSMPLSHNVYGRVAVDWRFRVAGNAEPDSGPALTVGAGF